MYNHWLAKIRFKKQIENHLKPLLKQYLRRVVTPSLSDQIRDVVDNWLDNQNDTVFEVHVMLELERVADFDGSLVDIIKTIKIIPQDV